MNKNEKADAAAALKLNKREIGKAKMQAKRRVVNLIALALSLAAMAFGLFWLIWILYTTVTLGVGGLSVQLFTEMTPPPGATDGVCFLLVTSS